MQVAIQVVKPCTRNIGPLTLIEEEAERIVRRAEQCGVTLRLMGGMAVRFHCHGPHSAHLREHGDIDLFGLSDQWKGIFRIFNQLGYAPNCEFNGLYGQSRLQYLRGEHQKDIDVFLDKFEMEHTLDFRSRLWLDDLTIPITDLLLTKLQMTKLEAKDTSDVVAILEDHELGHSDDRETINLDYLGNLCSRDWDLYRSIIDNVDRIKLVGQGTPGITWSDNLTQKLETIRGSLMTTRKGLKWNARSIIGDRVKWYREIEIGEGEV